VIYGALETWETSSAQLADGETISYPAALCLELVAGNRPPGRIPRSSGGHSSWGWRDRLHCAGVNWCAARRRPRVREHTCNQRFRSRCAWSDEAGPALTPESLADALVGGPGCSARSRWVKSHATQPVGVAEVGELEIQSPAMVVVGHVVLW
jgi:hypothetical protein